MTLCKRLLHRATCILPVPAHRSLPPRRDCPSLTTSDWTRQRHRGNGAANRLVDDRAPKLYAGTQDLIVTPLQGMSAEALANSDQFHAKEVE